jgi:hypothetical protein
MTEGLLPASLTCVALGLALARERPVRVLVAVTACVVGATAGSFLQPWASTSIVLPLAAWLSLALAAGAGLMRTGLPWPWTLPLALNGGLWAGSQAGASLELPLALAGLAAVAPARMLVAQGRGIAVRVVASWLVTIGVLNAAIPLTTPTPGYVRDHME